MKYYFHVNLHLFDVFIDMMSDFDKSPSTKYLSPILMVGLPLVAIVLNGLAIVYAEYNKLTKEISIVIKLKWINILIIAVSAMMICIFILYAVVENIHHAYLPCYH